MKTWVNGELLNADKMNTLEQSVPASATSSNGVVTFKNGNGTDLFSVEVGAPAPTNMITNGDFSVAGATTDGWTATYPARVSLSISNSRLVMTCTSKSNVAYGLMYPVTIVSGHSYLIRYKLLKTLNDADGDARVVRVMFGNSADFEVQRRTGLVQNDEYETVCAATADANYTDISICFGGGIATTSVEIGESMMELYYIEMYDITDIVAGWTA